MTLRVYPPLPADHPLVVDGDRCAKCHECFKAGDRTTVIPVPATRKESIVEALPAHARCIEAMIEGRDDPEAQAARALLKSPP